MMDKRTTNPHRKNSQSKYLENPFFIKHGTTVDYEQRVVGTCLPIIRLKLIH